MLTPLPVTSLILTSLQALDALFLLQKQAYFYQSLLSLLAD